MIGRDGLCAVCRFRRFTGAAAGVCQSGVEQIGREARDNRLANLPPILAFQSVMDSTVSTRALPSALQTVVMDSNFGAASVEQRRYSVTIITNSDAHSFSTLAKITPAGSTRETVVPLRQAWPQDVYSLSHVAVPFPPDDDLYGREPGVKNRYGISLGTIALWGETSVLSVGKEALMRVTSNPFYDYMQERIDSHIGEAERHLSHPGNLFCADHADLPKPVEFIPPLHRAAGAGSEESVVTLFHKIRDDKRHSGVVELLRDYGPRRRFENVGMLLFDLQTQSPKEVLQSVLHYSKLDSYLTSDDRVFKFIQTFITGRRPSPSGARYAPEKWSLSSEASPFGASLGLMANQTCQFALQPIVEPSEGKISSLEALIRGNDGGSPEHFFSTLDPDKIYEVDLQTKAYAFALAKKLGIGSHKIAVNLLPMSLVNVPGAVEFLVEQIKLHGLQPEQVVIEVTENEMISGA
ncbi:hypothetical protein L1887_45632 [Cichorium endivia]|nr:hypothetical protein L1887_45632 [Cichorium endivia]